MRHLARFALLALTTAVAALAATPSSIVTTTHGQVQGTISERYAQVSTFKGIPYAAPPVGSLRFAASVPPASWTGVYNASEFSAGCMNVCGLPVPSFTCTPVISEDCLYLNVFTPAQLPASNTSLRPVLLFIHGGAFIAGAGGTPIYEASKLAATQGIVVVTFNYRLGVFGAMYLDTVAPGNQMLADQRRAMAWVQDNIAAFGGDPAQVTLGGESAGAISVGAHLVSPRSTGYFKAAYMSSNPYGLKLQNVKLATSLGQKVVKAAGCDDTATPAEQLQCLQGVSANTLLSVSNDTRNVPWPTQILTSLLPWMPVVDPSSDDLPVEPFAAAGTSATMQVPILIGTNANDSIPFVYDFSAKPLSQPEMDGVLAYVFGLDAVAIRLQYGDCDCTDARYWFSDIATDYMFYCATRNVVQRLSNVSSPSAPVYMYVFGHRPTFAPWMWNAVDPLCDTKVCHADDVPFVFDNLHLPNGGYVPTPSPNERTLIAWLQDAIGTFVRDGRMSTATQWPVYNAADDVSMWVQIVTGQTAPSTVTGHHADNCALWDKLGWDRR